MNDKEAIGNKIRKSSTPSADQDADAQVAHGTALAMEGRRQEAIGIFRKVVRLQPHHAKAQHNLGVALAEQQEYAEALSSFQCALCAQPNYAEAYYSMANTLGLLGRSEEAVAVYREALRLRADYVDALHNLGATLTQLGNPGEALVLLRQALRLRPDFPEGHNSLGLAYAEYGDFAAAEKCYEEALRLNPRYPDAHGNLGSTFKEQGKLEEALASYDMALALAPGIASSHWNRALTWLQMGNFEKGWPEYEWRWHRKGATAFPFAKWDGSNLRGRSILLHVEQGFGDMIQFIRYAPLIKDRGGMVFVAAPPSQPLPRCDTNAALMSLPHLFGTTLATVPRSIPYLQPTPVLLTSWSKRLHSLPGLNVGIVWSGNPRHKWDRHRSIPLLLLEPLDRVDNVSLVSLQKDAGTEQLPSIGDRFPILDLGADIESFMDTAAALKCLDLLICCDTAVAHLAGSLGVRVWVALSTVVDWRWLLKREDSPWYPTMRLFRQPRLGDWQSVILRMASELTRLVAEKKRQIQPNP
jgi:tetratricopeptide (TPR) repeat protein